jgi:hypothetical protein
MPRLVLRLLVGFMAFLLGTSLAGVASLSRRPVLPAISLDEERTAPPPVESQTLTVVGGMDACGPTVNSHLSNLSDGTSIATTCEQFSSAARADRELRKRLKEATEIIEREPNLDGRGRKIGERVVAKTSGVLVLSTERNNLCSTSAPSLKHLQWFEHR